MKDILNSSFVMGMQETTANMYRLGWDERNGGNISCLIDENELAEYLDLNKVIRTIPTGFDATELAGKILSLPELVNILKTCKKIPKLIWVLLELQKMVKTPSFYGALKMVVVLPLNFPLI